MSDVKKETVKNKKDIIDTEERKKLIESFAIKDLEENVSKKIETKTSTKEENKNLDYFLSDDYRKKHQVHRKRNAGKFKTVKIELVLLIIVIALFIWFGALENLIFNAKKLLSKESPVVEKIVGPEDNFVVEDVKLASYGVGSKVDKLKTSVEKSVPKVEVISVISKVWKINRIKDNGAVIMVSMIENPDRIVTVKTGDVLLEAGTVQSIKKTDGKWFVICSDKIIAE